jgi:hypothetical protein
MVSARVGGVSRSSSVFTLRERHWFTIIHRNRPRTGAASEFCPQSGSTRRFFAPVGKLYGSGLPSGGEQVANARRFRLRNFRSLQHLVGGFLRSLNFP